MIHKLDRTVQQQAETDVLVIGGGTAGLIAATQLAEFGLRVVCLESGLETQIEDEHPLNEVVHSAKTYRGATAGRFRCLGGTSTRWGGALIPFAKEDLNSPDWPIAYEEIVQHIATVEDMFQLGHDSYDDFSVAGLEKSDFRARLAKWPPFTNRNVATLTEKSRAKLRSLDIWLNATATDFSVSDGILHSVRARSDDGGEINISAREIIFASGAIENTRLLLLLNRQNGGSSLKGAAQIGRYFSDHLSVVTAKLKPKSRSALNEVFGFQFASNGVMRNIRFELSDDTPLRGLIPPCFVHVAFVDTQKGGFATLRQLLQCIQKRQPPQASLFRDLLFSFPWLVRAAWWKLIKKRLLYPDKAEIQIHVVIEQAPLRENRISLSDQRADTFGNPLAVINWSVSNDDIVRLQNASAAFEKAWRNSGLSSLADIELRPATETILDLHHSGGIFHPVGSTRMSQSPETGVVDTELRPFGLSNVTVLSTSVLPSSGGANPTMMLLLLTVRAVIRIKSILSNATRSTNPPYYEPHTKPSR